MQGTTCNVEYDPDSEGETVFSTITGDNMQTEVFSNQVLFIHKLRVNVKSLAAESRLIREEAYRCGRQYVSYLTEHRRGRLREESRAAQLDIAEEIERFDSAGQFDGLLFAMRAVIGAELAKLDDVVPKQ